MITWSIIVINYISFSMQYTSRYNSKTCIIEIRKGNSWINRKVKTVSVRVRRTAKTSMRWFSRRLNAERKERNERKKFELEKGRDRGENGRGMRMRKKKKRVREISFRTTTFRFHRSYTSRWIPIQLAALSHSVSFSATRGRALLIGAAKSMLERTTKGDDDRMCVRFVASRKSFAREDRAKFQNRWLEIVD